MIGIGNFFRRHWSVFAFFRFVLDLSCLLSFSPLFHPFCVWFFPSVILLPILSALMSSSLSFSSMFLFSLHPRLIFVVIHFFSHSLFLSLLFRLRSLEVRFSYVQRITRGISKVHDEPGIMAWGMNLGLCQSQTRAWGWTDWGLVRPKIVESDQPE